MPVKIPDALPAKSILERENIFVMSEKRALSQDIRPLKLLILNLMPLKSKTETSLLRRLSNTPLQIEVEFLHMASHQAANVSVDYLKQFYKTFDQVADSAYDGLIITGAPVEQLAFEAVDYWPELCQVMEWASGHVFSTLFLCWGAQAGLYYHYQIDKFPLEKKMFGIFDHQALIENTPLLRGFDDNFKAPHSRHTETREADVRRVKTLEVLASSPEAGLYIVASANGRQVFVFGHPEYEVDTLAQEYERDRQKGLDIEVPRNYFIEDDSSKGVEATWFSHAQLLYTNWLNYYVYQTTPYDLTLLPKATLDQKTLLSSYQMREKSQA